MEVLEESVEPPDGRSVTWAEVDGEVDGRESERKSVKKSGRKSGKISGREARSGTLDGVGAGSGSGAEGVTEVSPRLVGRDPGWEPSGGRGVPPCREAARRQRCSAAWRSCRGGGSPAASCPWRRASAAPAEAALPPPQPPQPPPIPTQREGKVLACEDNHHHLLAPQTHRHSETITSPNRHHMYTVHTSLHHSPPPHKPS